MGAVLMQNTNNIKQANLALERKQHETALLLAVQKMQIMQSQLSPHFLFNCLGAISGLARQGDKDTLVEAVAKVGNLLRFTINNASENWISLDEEIGFCEDYLSLQHLRSPLLCVTVYLRVHNKCKKVGPVLKTCKAV